MKANLAADIPLAGWARSIRRSALQDMLMMTAQPGILSLALGLPAPELFPTAEFSQAVTEVLARDTRALQYSPPFGPLKSHLVSLMAERGVRCTEEQIFLTAGAQQGMNLLARLLLEPGRQVVMEAFGYTGFHQVIEPYQPEIMTVPTDLETGMDVQAVESILSSGPRPSFIYAITDGHNPLGVSISRDKRARLVELASQYGVPIIEDDAYGFIHYGDAPLPPMKALDEKWVFYVGSFSKIMGPSLRVGWLVVPEELVYKLSIVKESSDIDTATLSQRAISAYLDSGQLRSHLERVRGEYRRRRDTMLIALREQFPGNAIYREPSSGFFIWVELGEAVDTVGLLTLAVETEQVAFIPGAVFSPQGRRGGSNCLRLNFSFCDPHKIEDGIARLGRVLQACIT